MLLKELGPDGRGRISVVQQLLDEARKPYLSRLTESRLLS